MRYTRYDDPENTGTFKGEVERALKATDTARVVVTSPGEYRLLQEFEQWEHALPVPVDVREDDRFLCTPEAFADWAKGRKQLRMEYFYREMRRKFNALMNGSDPIGG